MSTDASRARPARRRSGRLLTIAAVIGAVSLVCFLASVLFGVRTYAFASGSMEPTIPRGSLGFTVERSVDSLREGDVVTVARDGALPITHRLVSMSPVAGGVGADLVLRGDANPDDDPRPYRAERVQLLVGSVPLVGFVLGAVLGQPVLVAVLTVLLAVGVTWYWWPGTGRRRAGASEAVGGARAGSAS